MTEAKGISIEHLEIHPEVTAFNEQVEQVLAEFPRLDQTPIEETRQARAEGRTITGDVVPVYRSPIEESRSLSTKVGPVPVTVFTPEERPVGTYIHIHGGGFVFEGNPMLSAWLEDIARTCRVTVVSVEYRLAPEQPYPAAIDDCEAATRWIVEHAANEFGSDRIAIGGESAGAHLTAATCNRLRQKHNYSGFLAAVLTYGCFDLSLTPSVRNWGERNLVLSTPTMEWFCELFVPDARMRRDADVSPLYADLRGFPPSLLSVGTLDPLLDDSLFMNQRLLAAGCDSELVLYPGGIHGFDFIDTPVLTEPFRSRVKAFIRDSMA